MTWIDRFLLSEEQAQVRMDQCTRCSYYTGITKMCSLCRCFMPAKIKLPLAECPAGKWTKIQEQQ